MPVLAALSKRVRWSLSPVASEASLATSTPPARSASPALFGVLALALLGAAGCQREPFDGQHAEGDELRVLLEDGEITALPGARLTATDPPAPPPPKEPPPPIGVDGGVMPPTGGVGGGGGGRPDSGPVPDALPVTGGAAGGGMAGACVPFGNDGGVPPKGGTGPIGGRPIPGGSTVGAFPVDAAPDSTDSNGPSDPTLPPVDPPPVFCRPGPLASWSLDDCNSQRTELRDRDFFSGFTAYRSVGVSCVEGIEGQGVSLGHAEDLVYVPDQPVFTFQAGATVAAWLKPDRVTGLRTIFRKRDGLTSALALMIVDRSYVFVVNRAGALPAAVSAPARAGQWTHVAATYDGTSLRLFIDGRMVATTTARGRIKDGEGPLLFGNDIFQRRFEGAMDGLWFDTQATSPEVINSLTCRRSAPRLVATPEVGPAVQPGTPVAFDFAITNQNAASCPAEFFSLSTPFDPDFRVDNSGPFSPIAPGETQHLTVNITSSEESEREGATPLTFIAFDNFGRSSEPATVSYVMAPLEGCRVSTRKELLIRDLSVIDDPLRTSFRAPPGDPARGAWTFKRLMEEAAPSPEQAPAMVEAILDSFGSDQVVNGFTVAPRPGMKANILDRWPRVNGQLDLEAAPLQLMAIVNRIDVRRLSEGHAGEGRFVFQFVQGPSGGPQFPFEATMIFEYLLPATSEADVLAWANAWHALGTLPFPSEEYNAALNALTDRFAKRGVMPARPNGSALSQLRTNEIAFGFGAPWELREFNFNAAGLLVPATIKLTPDQRFDFTTTLANYVNQNEASILLEQHNVPETFEGQNFLAGSVFNFPNTWFVPGADNPEARHKFALNTCNGCHSAQETNSTFQMIGPRFPGQEPFLSQFLTGTTAFDVITGQPRVLNDLRRRNDDMRFLVGCEPLPPLPQPGGGPGGGSDAGAGGMGGSGSGGGGTADAGAVRRAAPAATTPATGTTTGFKPTIATGIGRVH